MCVWQGELALEKSNVLSPELVPTCHRKREFFLVRHGFSFLRRQWEELHQFLYPIAFFFQHHIIPGDVAASTRSLHHGVHI